MVASAKISVKSIHPQEGSNKQRNLSSSFHLHRATKSAVTHPSCSSCDSASDEISVIDIKKMADRAVEAELDFDEKQAALFIAS